MDADKDQDGRLNMDEWFDYWDKKYNYFKGQYGQYIELTDEEIEKDYNFMCELAESDDGPDWATI